MKGMVNGRAMARDIKAELTKQIAVKGRVPVLGVLMAAEAGAATEQFVRVKRRFAERIGMKFLEKRIPAWEGTAAYIEAVTDLAEKADGIIVQLPLPQSIDTLAVLNVLPPEKDIDVLSAEAWTRFEKGERDAFVPPVAAAIGEILNRHAVPLLGAAVAIVGTGRLVGKPSIIFLKRLGADVRPIDIMTPQEEALIEIAEADVIVSGTGSPYLIKPEMVKEGVVLIDAGTSESSGAVVGDVDPRCADKATLYTPVPGGVGPVAVAMLFRNLLVAHAALQRP